MSEQQAQRIAEAVARRRLSLFKWANEHERKEPVMADEQEYGFGQGEGIVTVVQRVPPSPAVAAAEPEPNAPPQSETPLLAEVEPVKKPAPTRKRG